ncbi:MAG: alpha/beta hydrolase [Opitutaceae bacterium]|nr:alpha/beta hydrolase [Opitutaceae bacterium]
MLRWIFLGIAMGLLAAASLVWVKAPTVVTWKLAVLVSEFGHLLLVVPLVVGVVAAVQARSGESRVPWVTLVLVALTVISLLRPVVSAWRVASTLPARMEAAFGVRFPDREPIRLAALWAPPPQTRVTVETKEVLTPGTSVPLKLDFYRAVRPAGTPAPCVVVIHGGGWDSGDREQLSALNHRLAGRGFAVAAISYRLAPAHRWPAQLDDVVANLQYLRREAAALGIDPSRLVLLGRSAGGQLATAVGYRSDQPGIRGVVAYYAPHDLHFAWAWTKERDVLDSFSLMRNYLGGSPEEQKQAFTAASAYLAVTPRTPPTLLVHGQNDSLVWHRQSERLAERLAEEKVPHVFVSLPWAVHAFDFNPNGPAGQLATYALDSFLAAVTR